VDRGTFEMAVIFGCTIPACMVAFVLAGRPEDGTKRGFIRLRVGSWETRVHRWFSVFALMSLASLVAFTVLNDGVPEPAPPGVMPVAALILGGAATLGIRNTTNRNARVDMAAKAAYRVMSEGGSDSERREAKSALLLAALLPEPWIMIAAGVSASIFAFAVGKMAVGFVVAALTILGALAWIKSRKRSDE